MISKLNKFQKDGFDAQSVFLKKSREDFPEVIPPIIPSFMACFVLFEVDFDTKKLVLFSATSQ